MVVGDRLNGRISSLSYLAFTLGVLIKTCHVANLLFTFKYLQPVESLLKETDLVLPLELFSRCFACNSDLARAPALPLIELASFGNGAKV